MKYELIKTPHSCSYCYKLYPADTVALTADDGTLFCQECVGKLELMNNYE